MIKFLLLFKKPVKKRKMKFAWEHLKKNCPELNFNSGQFNRKDNSRYNSLIHIFRKLTRSP